MLPGPTYVYACPDCQLRVSKRSIMSGNTLGATYYSDLRVDALMYPRYPSITKCERCDCTFWLDESTKIEGVIMPQIARFYDDEFIPSETKNPVFGDQLEIKSAYELDREGIKDALFMNIQRNEEEEQYLRFLLLWAYHKQLEDGTLLRETINKDLDYLENIDSLLHLTNNKNVKKNREIGTYLFRAELHRYAGRFDQCMKILKFRYALKFWHPIIKKMKQKCRDKNRDVFVLNY